MSNVSQARRRTLGLFVLVAAISPILLSSNEAHAAGHSRIINADSASVAPDPSTAAGGSWTVGRTSAGNVQKGPGIEGGHNSGCGDAERPLAVRWRLWIPRLVRRVW